MAGVQGGWSSGVGDWGGGGKEGVGIEEGSLGC